MNMEKEINEINNKYNYDKKDDNYIIVEPSYGGVPQRPLKDAKINKFEMNKAL